MTKSGYCLKQTVKKSLILELQGYRLSLATKRVGGSRDIPNSQSSSLIRARDSREIVLINTADPQPRGDCDVTIHKFQQ